MRVKIITKRTGSVISYVVDQDEKSCFCSKHIICSKCSPLALTHALTHTDGDAILYCCTANAWYVCRHPINKQSLFNYIISAMSV